MLFHFVLLLKKLYGLYWESNGNQSTPCLAKKSTLQQCFHSLSFPTVLASPLIKQQIQNNPTRNY